MLECNHHSLEPLCVSQNPSAGLWHAIASPLPANVEENGSYFRIEVLVIDPIPLVPVSGISVVVVVQNLVEPMLA